MESYSANGEDLFLMEICRAYFPFFENVTVLSIGENDGVTLSNSRLLIENGAKAHLLEPCSEPFSKLQKLYKDNQNVKVYKYAIANKKGKEKIHFSGSLLGQGDSGLVSSLVPKETERFRKNGVKYSMEQIECITFKDFMDICGCSVFNIVTIDTEGLDLDILRQINPTEIGAEVFVLEHNFDSKVKSEMINYLSKFGFDKLREFKENIIIFK